MNRRSHYFFALELSKKCKLELEEWARRVREVYAFKSWVHKEDYHITLAFLGAVEEEKLKIAIHLIEQQIGQYQTFTIEINRLGIFGQKDNPRILWADAEKTIMMQDVQVMVYNACLEAGFQLDTKPFVPHITLARRSKNRIEAGGITEWGSGLPNIMPCEIKNVVLYRTDTEKQPKYEPIVRFPLGNE